MVTRLNLHSQTWAKLTAITLTLVAGAGAHATTDLGLYCQRIDQAGWLGPLMTKDRDLCLIRARLALAAQQRSVHEAAPPSRQPPPYRAAVPSGAPLAPSDVERGLPPQAVAGAGDTFRADVWMNIRSGPGVDHGVVGRIAQDERVALTGARNGDWWQVVHQTASRRVTGWVFSVWLRRPDERP